MKKIPVFVCCLLSAFFLLSCEESEKDPAITTSSIIGLSGSSYYVKATVLEIGSYPVKDYGFIYHIGNSENYYPGNENKYSLGSSLKADTFSTIIQIPDLSYYSPDMIYIKAYLTNERGTVYAKSLSTKLLKIEASSVFPSFGKTGDTLIIKGKNFDVNPANNIVTFNGSTAGVISATSTQLKVVVPSNISIDYYYNNSIDIKVRTGNQVVELNDAFTLTPSPTSFSPNHGTWSSTITIYGSGINNCIIYFNDIPYTIGNSYYSGSVSVQVPSGVNTKTFRLYIEKYGKKVEVPGGPFTMDNLKVNNVSPARCFPGTTVSLTGSAFNPSISKNRVYLGDQLITLTPSYYTSILQFSVPSSISEGKYNLSVSNGIDSISLLNQLEILRPEITDISPDSAYANTKFSITGRNFLLSSGAYVYFDSYSTYCTVQDSTVLKGTVPNIEPGTYKVSFTTGNFTVKSPTNFKILAPVLTSITPASGAANSAVIINGNGFGTSTSNISVYFGSLQTTPMSVTNTQINVKVPSGVTSGKWMVSVKVNGYTIPETLYFDVP